MPFWIQTLPGAPGVIPFQTTGLRPAPVLPPTVRPGPTQSPNGVDWSPAFPDVPHPGFDPSAPGAFPPRVWPPRGPRLAPDAPPFMPGIPDGPPGFYPDPRYPVVPRYPGMPRGRVPDETGRPWQPGDPLPGGNRPPGGTAPAKPRLEPRNALGPVLPKSNPARDTPVNRDNCKRLQDQFNDRANTIGDRQRKTWDAFNNLYQKANQAFFTPGMTTACLLELKRLLDQLNEILKEIVRDSTDLNYVQREVNQTPCLELVTDDGSTSRTGWSAHSELNRLDTLSKEFVKDYKAYKDALQDVLNRCLPKKGTIGQN